MSNNFLFIIGGQRSGTTYLSNLLNQHTKIQFLEPTFPEPKFFIHNPQANKFDFLKLFKSNENNKTILAEKSTSYFESDQALSALIKNFNDGLFVFLVRDPIERALSNYFFSIQNGLESRTPEEVFLLNKPEPQLNKKLSVNPFDYLKRSTYTEIIPRLKNIFGNHLLLISFEKLIIKPSETANVLLSRLNLEPLLFNIQVNQNKSNSIQSVSPSVHEVLQKWAEPQQALLKALNL